MSWLNSLFAITALALLAVATVITGLSVRDKLTGDDADAFKEALSDQPLMNSGKFLLFLQSYQFVTPAWRVDWLGSDGEYVRMLEEIPFPDGRDVIVLYPFWLLGLLISRAVWNSGADMVSKFAWITLTFVLLTVGGWILVKLLAFVVMDRLAGDLHIPLETLEQIRLAEFERTKEHIGIGNSMLLALGFALFYLKGLFGKSDE